MSLFKEKNSAGSELYARIRDHESSLKKLFEEFWQRYEPYSDQGFQERLQNQFHQRWWEMYLGIGLLNLNLNLNPSRKEKGPDFEIKLSDKTLWIEAVAPNLGNGDNSLPEMLEGVHNLPEKEFLLRLRTSLDYKLKKIKSYKNEYIPSNDVFIIAISSCALSGYGALMDFPVPAPLKILAGAKNLVLNEKGNFVNFRPNITKNSGSTVDTNLFKNQSFKEISAVLYSNCRILKSHSKPEESFQLFLNPNFENDYFFEPFEGIDIWYHYTDNGESIWKKKSA
ncbi:MAG: hypothetical protein WEB89_07990 [Balneolales bacterium]